VQSSFWYLLFDVILVRYKPRKRSFLFLEELHLVDEGEDWEFAQAGHSKQLSGLRLNPFGTVHLVK
jgi:hypothetical protein